MSYIYSHAKHRRSGSTMQKKKSRGDQKKWNEKREVLPGYPWEDRFTSHEEIRRYLNGDEITCLLCGKHYKQLGIHTTRVHNLDIEDYKFKFNIPQKYSMVGRATMQTKKDFMASPKGRILREKVLPWSLGPKPYIKSRRVCDLVIETSIKSIRKYNNARKS